MPMLMPKIVVDSALDLTLGSRFKKIESKTDLTQ